MSPRPSNPASLTPSACSYSRQLCPPNWNQKRQNLRITSTDCLPGQIAVKLARFTADTKKKSHFAAPVDRANRNARLTFDTPFSYAKPPDRPSQNCNLGPACFHPDGLVC